MSRLLRGIVNRGDTRANFDRGILLPKIFSVFLFFFFFSDFKARERNVSSKVYREISWDVKINFFFCNEYTLRELSNESDINFLFCMYNLVACFNIVLLRDTSMCICNASFDRYKKWNCVF